MSLVASVAQDSGVGLAAPLARSGLGRRTPPVSIDVVAPAAASVAGRGPPFERGSMRRFAPGTKIWIKVAGLLVALAAVGGCGSENVAASSEDVTTTTVVQAPTTAVVATAPPTTAPATLAPTTTKPKPKPATTTRRATVTTRRAPVTTRKAPATTARPSNCDPAYPGSCLHDGIGDYDCAGGSGNGPNYVSGPIRVRPPDPFDLDRDGDGLGCED
jgi:hypothetical protein